MANSKLMTQVEYGVTIVSFLDSRILDESNVQAIADELNAIVDKSVRPAVLIDFLKVEYLSSAVLGKLVALHKKTLATKGVLKLCGMRPAIAQIFRVTKLDRVFDVHPDVAIAINAFRRSGVIK